MPSAADAQAALESAPAPELPAGCEPYIVFRQEVELEVDFRNRSVSGVSTIHLFLPDKELEEISFDARQCDIDLDKVTVDGRKVKASFSDPYDLMGIPQHWQLGVHQNHVMMNRMRPLRPHKRPEVPILQKEDLICSIPADRSLKVALRPDDLIEDEARRMVKIKSIKGNKNGAADNSEPDGDKNGVKICIPFRSKHIRDGLHFVGVSEGDTRYPHVYTRHSLEPGTASCIFPCVDDPGSRNPWKISIKCPRTLGDVFNQPLATQPAAAPLSLNESRKRKAGDAYPSSPPRPSLEEEDKLREMTVVCSGNLAGEQIDPQNDRKKIMTFECQPAAAQHIGFAVGPFEHVDLWADCRTEEADERLGANAAKIHAYCLPGRDEEVRYTCAPIVAAADSFAPEFGKYPFESYKVCFVEDMVSDTAAAASLSLCSTRLLYPDDIIDHEIEVTRNLVHALASQYFGVHIVPNQRSDTWLIVGIQWFMTDLFMKSLCGNNWYRFHLKTMADKLIAADVNRPSLHDLGQYLHIGEFELDFMALKAPLVLYILDQRLSKIPGSTGVLRIISSIVSSSNISNFDFKKTCLSVEAFRQSCEKKSQYNPDELWDQWVFGAGCPKLMVKQRFNKKNLNVDITITQAQESNEPKPLTRDEFWRELQEKIHDVRPGETPKLFTGPFTIRIHEADGTPYEHYLSITERDRNGTTLSIAYNTKYKRLKRTKKAQAAAVNTTDKHDVQEDDVIYFNMLGDVLTSDKDVQNWGLQDWADGVQTQMDQESYEWIRFDCNFEWICETMTDMPGYMYLAQLQQDRDVVAHQDALLFFKRGKRHGVAATIETRAVYDRRYYHGIRTMAVDDLTKQADPDLNYIGLAQLILVFRHFFCDKIVGKAGSVSFPPSPNDFRDKAQYAVQSAIPGAIARTKEKGRCSKDGRSFLLDLLLFNDNSQNAFSDQFYIAKLLDALTTSLIPEKMVTEGNLLANLNMDDEDDVEFKSFIENTIEEIDKYRRMDEWTSTHQNIWTTTALNCKMRLMKARVIPTAPIEFVQYLQDDNIDLVRLKAFECLVELGMLAKAPILRLLLSCLGTDTSPFVRDRLFKIFCKGVADIAFGEAKIAPEPQKEVEDDESGLIIERDEGEAQQKQLGADRRDDITQALRALKHELGNDELARIPELTIAMWRAVESSTIGVREKCQLLDLCSAMFEPEDSLLITLKYPKYWKCAREPIVHKPAVVGVAEPRPNKKRLLVRFTPQYRTEPRVKAVIGLPPPELPAPEIKPPEPKKIKLSTKLSFSGSSAGGPPTPSLLGRKDSISVTMPRPGASDVSGLAAVAIPKSSLDSIAVQPVTRLSTPLAIGPPSQSLNPPVNGPAKPVEKRPKPPKRKSEDSENIHRPKKIIKTENGLAHIRPRKIVTLRFSSWDKLPRKIRDNMAQERRGPTGSGTIVATPTARRLAAPNRSASPSVLGSPILGSFASNSRPTSGPKEKSSSSKQRKPLPSSAPHLSSPAQGATSNAATSNGTSTPAPAAATPAPPKKSIIKLKLIAPSRASPS
ncbi:hypothetical protein B0T26DRAFT_633688 [Lasiosphaeria miniovina]|uniref:Transcription initiation factor TFIID subunit 2 n=1 Tax=Lasiosphaeria miniovina TaxID=1954250 RepID=A0AA40EA11_9PEZI|nr:uncharacterized protein B0T26DRAFT_633688 [Lasiosphaeria miniovina]KAK0733924.1 hypothetical protein B0T26DRAFT_633688 [Lasiosphaeria miniovina]